jgi:hypothetical protein
VVADRDQADDRARDDAVQALPEPAVALRRERIDEDGTARLDERV